MKNKDSHILVIEDDTDINQLLVTILTKEGYEVTPSFSGTEARMQLERKEFSLIIMDLMLPGLSGEELLQEVREEKTTPVLVLTAKGGLEDKVHLLELGADDYMTKPFEGKELTARVNAHLRRKELYSLSTDERKKATSREDIFALRELVMDKAYMLVKIEDQEVDLTAHEFHILQVMLENPRKVFSKEALYEAVWKSGYYGEDNTVSVHVSNIRKKIAEITKEEYIKTVWGIGYKLIL